MEIWKDIKNYEGLYQVSDTGRVKSLKFSKEKILKATKNNKGYLIVSLYKDGVVKIRTVHQLVAESFLNHVPCRYKLVVNHINFDKLDNRVENLEIVTNRENTNLKHIKSSSKYTGVTWHKPNKKWKSQIYVNGKQKSLGYFKDEYVAHLAYERELSKIKYN